MGTVHEFEFFAGHRELHRVFTDHFAFPAEDIRYRNRRRRVLRRPGTQHQRRARRRVLFPLVVDVLNGDRHVRVQDDAALPARSASRLTPRLRLGDHRTGVLFRSRFQRGRNLASTR